jgi:hypothetical protein
LWQRSAELTGVDFFWILVLSSRINTRT